MFEKFVMSLVFVVIMTLIVGYFASHRTVASPQIEQTQGASLTYSHPVFLPVHVPAFAGGRV